MTRDSTPQARHTKPRKGFPLFPHQHGYWAKKIRGKLHYFGKVANDPKGDAALDQWLGEKDALSAGRTPRITPSDGVTVAQLCNHFLTAKEQQREAGDIRPRTFAEDLAACNSLVRTFGRERLVDGLAGEDFQALRAKLAIATASTNLELYEIDASLIEKPARIGPAFKKPAVRIMCAHRQKNEHRMFEAAQIRSLIKAAGQPIKAMILLGDQL